MYARSSRVDGELADRDGDASDPPVAYAKDLLCIRGDDEVHLLRTKAIVLEGLLYIFWTVHREVDPPGPAVLMAVELDGLSDRRVIDYGKHLPQVLREELVEEHLVAVLQRAQIYVLVQVGCLVLVLVVGPLGLLFEGQNRRWQEPDQPQVLSLLLGEGRALVEQGLLQYLSSWRHCFSSS